MKMDGRMKNEGTNEGLVLDRLQKETRRWRRPHDSERGCPCVRGVLGPQGPRPHEEGERERARDMRAITRHVSSICIQEDLLSGARWGRGRRGGGGGGNEQGNGGARKGCTTQIPSPV